jgi:CheY-like chemotaxis protein
MARNKVSILIIEDNETDIYLAEAALGYLTDYDVELVIAKDGAAGLKALKADDYDVAFVDFNLPKYDGPTILEKVDQSIRSKCFMLTTSAADEHIAQVDSLKVAGYITKPLSQAHFREAMHAVVIVALSKDIKFLHKNRK